MIFFLISGHAAIEFNYIQRWQIVNDFTLPARSKTSCRSLYHLNTFDKKDLGEFSSQAITVEIDHGDSLSVSYLYCFV